MEELVKLSKYTSVFLLLAINLVILFFVLSTESVLKALLIFWSETIVVCFFSGLKILTAKGSPRISSKYDKFVSALSKTKAIFILVIFFGLFVAIHSILIVQVFGGNLERTPIKSMWPSSWLDSEIRVYLLMLEIPLVLFRFAFNGLAAAQVDLIFPMIMFFISHGYSFITNYISKEEQKHSRPTDYLIQPFRRIYTTQTALILGAFFVLILGVSTGPLIVLWAIKLITDLKAHLKERERFSVDI